MPFSFSKESRRRLIFGVLWWLKKSFFIFARSHMSHVFALVLAIFTLTHIFGEHWAIITQLNDYVKDLAIYYNLPFLQNFNVWKVFIVGVAVLTVAAAIWEFLGNKLATSPQEVRFIAGMDTLLHEFHKFQRKLDSAINEKSSARLLQEFLCELLKTSSAILCGNHNIDVALMLYDKEANELILDKSKQYQSTSAEKYKLPNELIIPLTKKPSAHVGPAEIAFKMQEYIAYMPKKKKKIGLIYKQEKGEKYVFEGFFEGWYPADEAGTENFCSILSIPVLSYKDDTQIEMIGVLNFTTTGRDLFIDRDYVMASCFASFVAQAIDANRKKLSDLETFIN
jgi:hypothetical protein